MKKKLTAVDLTMTILALTAGIMACIGRCGWGWFLFATLLFGVASFVTIGGKVELNALNQALQWLCLVECDGCGQMVRIRKSTSRLDGLRGLVITCESCARAGEIEEDE